MSLGQCKIGLVLAMVVGVVSLAARPAVADDVTPQSERETILQFHERLAENKARSLDTRRLAESVALSSVDQNNYDIKFYDVYIETHYYSQIIYGSVGFVAAAADLLVDEVEVDFSSNMTVDSVVAPSGHLTFSHSNDYIYITLDAVYSQGELFEFVVYYRGNPQLCGTFYASFFDNWNGYPIMNTMSEPYGARCFWPCKDHPGDKPDSMDIAVEVANQFYVATNGVLDSVVATGIGRDTYYYRVRYPMATYLFALSIADFTVYTDWYYYNDGADSMPIVNHCYPGLLSDALDGWGITAEAVGIYAENFGEYPFINEKYGHANVNYAGMEHQTITAGDGSGFGFSEYLVIHELAHHWWGNLITCASWHDIWLNEGWGTYSEAVYYLDLYGWDYYFNYMENLIWDRGGSVYCTDTTNVSRIFNVGLSYHKGAWVAHMLRGKLGDSLFFAGIDAWFNSEFRYGSATTEDFKNVWEIATGVELDAFINQWVYGEYFPNYHLFQASEPTDSTGYNIYMVVKQMQTTDPEVFEMPVEFAFFFEDGSSDTMRFDINAKKQSFKFVRDHDIIENGIEIDPRGWILKEVTNREWDFFIVTPDDEISNGEPDVVYADTVEVFGGSGDYIFLIVQGALPTGFTINNDGIISGITSDTGLFAFRVHAYDLVTYETDEADYTMRIGTPSTCCGLYTGGLTGNTNCDEEGLLSLSDITRLIDRVYISKDPLCCEENGNVNGSLDGLITLSDITRLIDAVYVSKAPPEPCL